MEKLLEYFNAGHGRRIRLAEELGITPGAVSNWDRVPVERLGDIERITGISRHELRPDIFEGFVPTGTNHGEAAGMDSMDVKFTFDKRSGTALFASLMALVNAPDRPAEARRAFGERVLKLFDEGLAIDLDHTAAAGAGELVIGVKPSQRLADLVTAFGAGD